MVFAVNASFLCSFSIYCIPPVCQAVGGWPLENSTSKLTLPACVSVKAKFKRMYSKLSSHFVSSDGRSTSWLNLTSANLSETWLIKQLVLLQKQKGLCLVAQFSVSCHSKKAALETTVFDSVAYFSLDSQLSPFLGHCSTHKLLPMLLCMPPGNLSPLHIPAMVPFAPPLLWSARPPYP